MRTMHPSGSKSMTRSRSNAARRLLAHLSPRKFSVPTAAQGIDHSSHGLARTARASQLDEESAVRRIGKRLRKEPDPVSNQLAWLSHACYRSVRAGRSLRRRRAVRAQTAPPLAAFGSRRERSCARAPSWRGRCGAGVACARRSVWPRASSAARTARLP